MAVDVQQVRLGIPVIHGGDDPALQEGDLAETRRSGPLGAQAVRIAEEVDLLAERQPAGRGFKGKGDRNRPAQFESRDVHGLLRWIDGPGMDPAPSFLHPQLDLAFAPEALQEMPGGDQVLPAVDLDREGGAGVRGSPDPQDPVDHVRSRDLRLRQGR